MNSKLNIITDELIVNIENTQLHESGLKIKYITKFKIGYGGFQIPNGRSYIDLPLWIKNEKACINIKNEDDKCFMYAVQCGVYEIYNKAHPERQSHYNNDRFKKDIPSSKYVNFDSRNFPMEIDDDVNNSIEEFEKDNDNRISINVYGIHKDIKKHGDDSLIGDYVNNINESKQTNNIKKDDRLLITEDDYDKYIFQCI